MINPPETYFQRSAPRPPLPEVVKAATAGARFVLVYLILGLVLALTLVSVAAAGSAWFEYGAAALVANLLLFFVPAYLIYRRAAGRVRRMLRHGDPGQAAVVRVATSHPRLHILSLSLSVAGREVQARLAVARPPELAAGDRVDLIVGRPRGSRGMFCALVPGVGAEVGRYDLRAG